MNSLTDGRCPVVAAFERQVDEGGDRPAVVVSDRELCYRALDEHANQLANLLLKRRGIRSESVALAVCDPGLMLAAMLGVLKAGRYYVPMNPAFPVPRLRAMFDQTRPGVVITDKQARLPLADLVADPDAVEQVTIEPYGGPGADTSRPDVAVNPEDLAYVLYTSGSTGTPKGVAQRRGDMAQNVLRHAALGVGPADRVSLISADGFVGAVSNVVVALLNGAALVPYSFHQDGAHGALDWLDRTGVTFYYSFPSFLRQLASVAEGQVAAGVRMAYLGGEPVLPVDLDAVHRLFPAAFRAIGLNSTETGLTRLHVLPPEESTPESVPVGRSVPGVDVVVLHDDGTPAPPNEPGEIVIRSAFVRPLLWTADGPVEAAREVAPGLFEFRTADRGTLDTSGLLYHRGRTDGMVKIRGFRVETSEVEAALSALPGVAEAAVVPYQPAHGQTELAGYIVVSGPAPSPTELRGRLAELLPRAMVPAALSVVTSLPRTQNGKVDRRRLPEPETWLGLAAGTAPAAAQKTGTDTEGRIANIWKAVLRTPDVTPEDDFFDLGGTSITALTVISRIRKEFGTPVRLAVLFQTPTVAALAAAVDKLRERAPE